jgi:glycosyltransferase involved in cell wall biosynthesis
VKVVVCFHEPHLGGATRSVERIVPLLAERGWEFSFWAPKPSELYDELAGRGWDVDGAPRAVEYSVRMWRLEPGTRERIARMPGYVRHYRAFLADRRPTLVHANSILTLAEALIARRDGIPTLLHAHEMLPLDPRGWMLRRVAWSRLDRVIAVSRPCAARLALDGRRPPVVYEGTPVPEQPVELKAEPRPFTVGTVAVVSTRKGSDLFVEAAQQLNQRNGDSSFRFQMVGDAHDAIERDWARSLLARARDLGIEHIPHTDVLASMRDWDAFVLPSRADPFPLSMLEAMASGLPVIGTRRDGIAEQIAPGTGMLIEPENARALADAIGWCAAQPLETRQRMGTAARERVAQHFTLAHQAEAIDRTYRRTLADAGRVLHASEALAEPRRR